MQFTSTAHFIERSVVNPIVRRQATGLFRRQRPSATTNGFCFTPRSASSGTIQTPENDSTPSVPTSAPSATDSKPTDVTNEPAYLLHFKQSATPYTTNAMGEPIWDHPLTRAVYDLNTISTLEQTHHPTTKLYERAALLAVKGLRTGFDIVSRYRGPGGAMTETDWLNRCLFLESVAGVPGMVGGMLRHLRSLRLLKRDYGWIHTLLEEAENERMHLLLFMNMKQPGYCLRALVVAAQGVFFNGFFLTYLVSPRTCHRFVGYLEEEAVKTYTYLLKDMEDGHLDAWKQQKAPLIAQTYYQLPETATVYDMIKCVRADECNHRDVNHAFADLDQKKGVSPFVNGHH